MADGKDRQVKRVPLGQDLTLYLFKSGDHELVDDLNDFVMALSKDAWLTVSSEILTHAYAQIRGRDG